MASRMNDGRVAQPLLMEEPALSENAGKVLEARYLKKNEAGECVETPRELFRRVAKSIADVETTYGGTGVERQRWEDEFYRLMTSGAFMPNSPTLMNAGREMGMLSACFVLPVRDSINDIFNSIKHTALIQKAGGGTGFAFDELRPTGDFIQSSGGTTSGPITFWRAFSEATNAIQQGAFRRGANMGMMYVHHPDILKFLHAKQDLNQFTNYNISVKMTDTWMEEFDADENSPQFVRNPRNGKTFVIPADIDIWKADIRSLIEVDCCEPVSPSGREKYYTTPKQIKPLPEALRGKVYTKRMIWDTIVKNAWQTGEPGVVFIDRINEANPTPHVGRMEATNPCGEQPLLPYEACNLGSVNLGLFVKNPCTPDAAVDWDALREAVHVSTRFLDNVIDANNYPLEEIDQICKSNRKIGLGVMGFADALFKLGVPYNSEAGVQWGERFMKFLNDEAHNYSEHLARIRGCFPNWKGSHWHTKYNRMMRNACTTTVAPTGTISIISNCSGGIEPMFSLAFIRNVLRGQKQGEKPLVEVNETFREVARARGFLSDELLERIAREGTLAHIDEVPEDIKRVFVCAHDIAPEWHMHMQGGFQRHCDSSISKTINFPHSASIEDVETIYRLAFELRCKGVTVYRDGCRSFQPMALKKEDGTEAKAEAKVNAKAEAKKEHSAPKSEHEAQASVPTNGAHKLSTDTAERGSDAQSLPHASKPPAATDAPRVAVGGAPAPIADAAASKPKIGPVEPPRTEPRMIEPMDLPEIVSGLRIRQITPFGNMHVKITVDPRSDRDLEVFAQLGKGGDVATGDLEGMCRMISLWLRAGGTLRHVIKQLEGIGSSLQIPTRAGRIVSLPDGLAAALKKYLKAKERFGLRPLLLGEVDLALLDQPAPPHNNVATGGVSVAQVSNPGNVGRVIDPTSPSGSPSPGGMGGSPSPGGMGVSPVRGDAERVAAVEKRLETNVPSSQSHTASASASRSIDQSSTTRMSSNGHSNGHSEIHADDDSATAVLEISDRVTYVDELLDEILITEETTEISASVSNGQSSVSIHRHEEAMGYKLKCPCCEGVLALQEGCKKCHSCGWSAC